MFKNDTVGRLYDFRNIRYSLKQVVPGGDQFYFEIEW